MVFVLVISSAFLHALWNAFLRRQPDKGSAGVVVVALAALTAVVVAGINVVLTHDNPFPHLAGLAFSVAAGVFEAGYFVSLIQALSLGPLASVYTVSRGAA